MYRDTEKPWKEVPLNDYSCWWNDDHETRLHNHYHYHRQNHHCHKIVTFLNAVV